MAERVIKDRNRANPELEQYKKYVKERIEYLSSLFANVAVGDFSKKPEIPEEEDEFTELYVGLDFMMDDLKLLMEKEKLVATEKARRAEAEKSKRYVENIMASMADTLLVIDPKGNIKNVNKVVLDLLGYREEELIGRPVGILFAAEEKSLFNGTIRESLLKEGFVKDVEMTYLTKDGKKVPMSFSGSVIRDEKGEMVGIVCVAKDLSEIKTLVADLKKAYEELLNTQKQLIQSEKLAGIGQLAAGVAHEINNPLTCILVYSTKLLEKLNDPNIDKTKLIETLPKYLAIIKDAGARCERITKALLAFSRQTPVEMVKIDLNQVIENTLALVSHYLMLQKINVSKNLQPDLPPIIGDRNQLQQVFTNLILNAQEAMPNSGTLTIATNKINDKWIEITFTDTGVGIPEENLGRIFDPFFTTKPADKGSGLGLSIAHGIIQAHKGYINVVSEVGRGTTFKIGLPIGEV